MEAGLAAGLSGSGGTGSDGMGSDGLGSEGLGSDVGLTDLERLSVDAAGAVEDSSKSAEDSSRVGLVIQGGDSMLIVRFPGAAGGVDLGTVEAAGEKKMAASLVAFLASWIDSGVLADLEVLLGLSLGELVEAHVRLVVFM